MEELIKALQIFFKYSQDKFPTHCAHDVLYINVVKKEQVSKEDLIELENLSFHWDEEIESFYSYTFGSN
jgi:hypothetical protein